MNFSLEKIEEDLKEMELSKLNPVIRFLTLSDMMIWGGYDMLLALLAIFLQQRLLVENSFEVIAFGMALYWIGRSLFQIPIARFLDKHKGYIDETVAVGISSIIISISIFAYLWVDQPYELYLVQLLYGTGVAINLPAWRKTFAKYLDKGKEGTEYSVYDVLTNLTVAFSTAMGGIIVENFGGFTTLILVSGSVALLGIIPSIFLLQNRQIKRSNS